jgi:hypothetical protein
MIKPIDAATVVRDQQKYVRLAGALSRMTGLIDTCDPQQMASFIHLEDLEVGVHTANVLGTSLMTLRDALQNEQRKAVN